MDTNGLAEFYFRLFALQKWGWEQDNDSDEDDDELDNMLKVKQGEPTGDAYEDYRLYHQFILSDQVTTDAVTYPMLISILLDKIKNAIADFLVETLRDSEDYENFTLGQFENEVWVQEYFNRFPGLQVIFERMINPPPPPPLRRVSIVPGGDGGKNLNKFLNEQPVRVLKMIIKNAGYTGYSKLKKKQLVSFIKNKL